MIEYFSSFFANSPVSLAPLEYSKLSYQKLKFTIKIQQCFKTVHNVLLFDF